MARCTSTTLSCKAPASLLRPSACRGCRGCILQPLHAYCSCRRLPRLLGRRPPQELVSSCTVFAETPDQPGRDIARLILT